MTFTLYYSPRSSSSVVSWALAELDVPHDRVRVDLAQKEQKKPEFLAINPNGKVPAASVDGQPMFESLAIVLYAAERFGAARKLWPAADDPRRGTAISWTVWSHASVRPALSRYLLATTDRYGAELKSEVLAKHAKAELDGLLGILEARLTASPYLLGDAFSLADLMNAAMANFARFAGYPFEPYPHVAAWLERCTSRPAFAASSAP